MPTLLEPPRHTPIIEEVDLCVIGGSCTGVFAAVAAARRGLRVAIVEALAYFGGTGTASMVCVWHSHMNSTFDQQIIAGLSIEVMDRLKSRNAVEERTRSADIGFVFNPAELVLELDRLVVEAKVRPHLHTRFVAPILDGPRITHIIIEDKTGRRAIAAKVFIDASGDADLLHRAGFPCYTPPRIQPPTTCFFFDGVPAGSEKEVQARIRKETFNPAHPDALRPGFLWGAAVPGSQSVYMVAGTRVHGANCADADQLTAAEIEGRRQVRAILDIIRRAIPEAANARLLALPARIGIRHSRQAHCHHQLTQHEVLHGQRFDDAIANGSYRVDVHSDKGEGLIFRYLDGRETEVLADGRREERRWKTDNAPAATFYQIPYRSILPRGAVNLLAAGRCLDADEGAYGAVRVMVNCNQLGEAAGVAASLAVDRSLGVHEIDTTELRTRLAAGGACVL